MGVLIYDFNDADSVTLGVSGNKLYALVSKNSESHIVCLAIIRKRRSETTHFSFSFNILSCHILGIFRYISGFLRV